MKEKERFAKMPDKDRHDKIVKNREARRMATDDRPVADVASQPDLIRAVQSVISEHVSTPRTRSSVRGNVRHQYF